MGFETTLVQQARLAEHWATPAGFARARTICETMAEEHGSTMPPARLCEGLAGELHRATPFYVAPVACGLLRATVGSFGKATLTPALLPCQTGFVWFDTPMPLPQTPSWEGNLTSGDLRAFVWDAMYVEVQDLTDRRMVAMGTTEHPANVISLSYYLEYPDQRQPVLTSMVLWEFGRDWSRITPAQQVASTGRDGLDEYARSIRRWVIQFLTFIGQRLAAVSGQPLEHKGHRRDVARVLRHVPEVRVVELRRRDYQQRDESAHRDVNWSCRWIVGGQDGFWRNQYYPSTGEYRPVLIAPFEKGPPGKPLRVYGQTVYDVKR